MIKKQVEDAQGAVAYWISDSVRPEKETLFFLHGLTADHTMFEQQIRCFDKGFNLIAWDALHTANPDPIHRSLMKMRQRPCTGSWKTTRLTRSS